MQTDLRLFIAAILVAAALACLSLFAKGAANGRAIAIRPAVPALYLDDGKAALDDEILYGMTVNILEGPDVEGRYRVETRYRNRTLVNRADLLANDGVAQAWEKSLSHCVVAPFAEVLAAPGLKAYPPFLTLPRGALLPVVGEDGEYFKVALADGTAGYARRAALREIRDWRQTDEATNRRRVVEDALSYLGAPYRWGGKTPAGLDCSGLASMAYLLNGLAIYRNSQPRTGFPIALLRVAAPADGRHTRNSLARAKPGDLIYWKGHQAVYLGEGKYLHANATAFAVTINSLLREDPDCRDDLADPAAVVAWGTAYPERPDELLVRSLKAKAADKRTFTFRAEVDGYPPTSAIIYPEGLGDDKPTLEIADPRTLVYGGPAAHGAKAPRHTYARPGTYRPVVVLTNANGRPPGGAPIVSAPFAIPGALVVE